MNADFEFDHLMNCPIFCAWQTLFCNSHSLWCERDEQNDRLPILLKPSCVSYSMSGMDFGGLCEMGLYIYKMVLMRFQHMLLCKRSDTVFTQTDMDRQALYSFSDDTFFVLGSR